MRMMRLSACLSKCIIFDQTQERSEERNVGVIPLDRVVEENVWDILHDEHPPGQPIHSSLITSPSSISDKLYPVYPGIFEVVDGISILKLALILNHRWCWTLWCGCMCTSYQKASTDLCEAPVRTAMRMCTSFLDPIPPKLQIDL